MKICSKCKTDKNIEDFSYIKSTNSYRSICKMCISHYKKEYYKNNIEKIKKQREQNRDSKLEYNKKYREQNKEKIKKQRKDYYENNHKNILNYAKEYRNDNRDKIKEYDKNNYKNNKDKINERSRVYYFKNKSKILGQKHLNKERIRNYKSKYDKTRYSNDPCFKLRVKISNSIRKNLKKVGSNKNRQSCTKFLRYNFKELKIYLESKFESWMNWDNWGNYDPKTWDDKDKSTWTWQIDHIIPHSYFNYSSMEDEEFKKCWDLSNLRPYSAKQNILDGSRR